MTYHCVTSLPVGLTNPAAGQAASQPMGVRVPGKRPAQSKSRCSQAIAASRGQPRSLARVVVAGVLVSEGGLKLGLILLRVGVGVRVVGVLEGGLVGGLGVRVVVEGGLRGDSSGVGVVGVAGGGVVGAGLAVLLLASVAAQAAVASHNASTIPASVSSSIVKSVEPRSSRSPRPQGTSSRGRSPRRARPGGPGLLVMRGECEHLPGFRVLFTIPLVDIMVEGRRGHHCGRRPHALALEMFHELTVHVGHGGGRMLAFWVGVIKRLEGFSRPS
jgi:hypothetical protein